MIETIIIFGLGAGFGIIATLAGIYVYAKFTMKRINSKLDLASRLVEQANAERNRRHSDHAHFSLHQYPRAVDIAVDDLEDDECRHEPPFFCCGVQTATGCLCCDEKRLKIGGTDD